jgi:hypothetical protein
MRQNVGDAELTPNVLVWVVEVRQHIENACVLIKLIVADKNPNCGCSRRLAHRGWVKYCVIVNESFCVDISVSKVGGIDDFVMVEDAD